MTSRVFDPVLRAEVEDVVDVPTWFQNKVKITGRPLTQASRKNERVQMMKLGHELGDLVGYDRSIFVPQGLKDSPEDRKLIGGHKCELLDVDPVERQAYENRWVYWADCGCGNRIVLTAKEILKRDKAGLGCARAACPVPSVRRQLWYNGRIALRFQMLQILRLWPDLVPKNLRAVGSYELMTAVYQREGVIPSVKEGKWWLAGIADIESIMHNELTLSSMPDKNLFPDGQIHIRIGSFLYPINELCESFEVELDDVLRERMKHDSDSKLMDELLGGE